MSNITCGYGYRYEESIDAASAMLRFTLSPAGEWLSVLLLGMGLAAVVSGRLLARRELARSGLIGLGAGVLLLVFRAVTAYVEGCQIGLVTPLTEVLRVLAGTGLMLGLVVLPSALAAYLAAIVVRSLAVDVIAKLWFGEGLQLSRTARIAVVLGAAAILGVLLGASVSPWAAAGFAAAAGVLAAVLPHIPAYGRHREE
jgi:hypothetical protein